MTRSFTVIGAGIVGVCCALHLQREGFKVRLVFDSESPLKLRWSHVPAALPWFLRFIANARPSRVEANAAARTSLLVHTHAGYAPLIESADASQWVDHNGLMMVFESEASFAGAAYALDLRRRNGVHMDILDGNEARQMEPSLSPRVIKAVSLPDVSRTIDPFRLTDALAKDFVRRGGEIVQAEVRGFEFGAEGPTRIVTDRGPLDVEQVVLAAGVWSRPLAKQLGTSVPLEAERGYHFALKRALVSADRNIAMSHMHEGIRATGVAEFAAPDAPPDMRIAERVQRHAMALVPGLKGEPASRWMGPRPSHPDSKPVIGRSPRHRNVLFAFGHDHLGLTMAGITGKLIAELATDRPTTVDLAPFRSDRF
jgi:D-amino-acid dehydrogenase